MEITGFNDTTRSGHIDTIKLRITDSERIHNPLFFVISDGKNNFPWDSNISKINGSANIEIKASSGLAAVKSKGFRVRIAEKGNPELNVVTDLEKDFVCQPAIKDPHFQVWEDSIKIKEQTPFLWEPERNHNINYTRTEQGIIVKDEGTVLRQSTNTLPSSIPVVANGSFGISITSQERSIEKTFSGKTETTLDTTMLPENSDYTIKVIGGGSSFVINQLGNGECIKGLNKN